MPWPLFPNPSLSSRTRDQFVIRDAPAAHYGLRNNSGSLAIFAAIPRAKVKQTPAAVRGNFMSVNFFPSAAPSDAKHWPFSGTARVSHARESSELIPCIRRQIPGIALAHSDPRNGLFVFFRHFFGFSVMKTPTEIVPAGLPWLDNSGQYIAHSGRFRTRSQICVMTP